MSFTPPLSFEDTDSVIVASGRKWAERVLTVGHLIRISFKNTKTFFSPSPKLFD